MSSMKSLLEDRQEREHVEAVAAALGISVTDLEQLNWTIEDHASDDGLLYGHNVYFADGSDPAILNRIKGLTNDRWVRIEPLSWGDGDCEPTSPS
jgi:hypothetical protein